MTDSVASKGAVLAGIRDITESEPQDVAQVRGAVAGLVDALEYHADQTPSHESRRCLLEAQRHFELGCMMAVKGLYAAAQEQ